MPRPGAATWRSSVSSCSVAPMQLRTRTPRAPPSCMLRLQGAKLRCARLLALLALSVSSHVARIGLLDFSLLVCTRIRLQSVLARRREGEERRKRWRGVTTVDEQRQGDGGRSWRTGSLYEGDLVYLNCGGDAFEPWRVGW